LAADDAIPVTVVTGFLGAGKTTLVNRWLGDYARGDVAVVVNEHGAVGVDGELLAARVRMLVEITGGCVCCSTQAELVRALEGLASREPRPARILVETSGAASPAGVLRAISAGGRDGALALDGVVTVVDASRAEDLASHDLAIEQVGYADVVVLSRADACSPERIAHAAGLVALHNGAAFAVSAARGERTDAAPSTLEALLAERHADLAPAPSPDAPAPTGTAHVYESVSLTLDGDVDGERFADFVEEELARFAGRLFRTKGILAIAGAAERMIVQGVADRMEVSFGAPWGDTPRTSRLVVVGFGLDRAALGAGFAACAAREPAPS
jgi:G3E family GTPase